MLNSGSRQRIAAILLAIFLAAARPEHALGENVLILSAMPAWTDPHTRESRLQNVLQAAGDNVTIGNSYESFSNPPLEGEDVVILDFDGDMPISGQQALIDFVMKGGGLIANAWTVWQWAALNGDYFLGRGGLEQLGRLLPVERTSIRGYPFGDMVTLTEAIAADPLLVQGIPLSFSFLVDSYDEAGAEALLMPQLTATVFFTSTGTRNSAYPKGFETNTSLVGWRFGLGHVLQLSATLGPHELSDPRFTRLFTNAITWAGHANRGPLVTELRFDNSTIESGQSLAATFLGAGLTENTYFDVRFRVPGSTTNEVAFNWQQGTSVQHTIPFGSGIGQWTVTGVRPHQNRDDHTAEFDPVSARIVVSP